MHFAIYISNFLLFFQEIRQAYDAEAASSGKPALLVTAAVAAGKDTIDTAYDIPAITRYQCLFLLYLCNGKTFCILICKFCFALDKNNQTCWLN